MIGGRATRALVVAVVLAAVCRQSGVVSPDGGGPDLQAPLPRCAAKSDCFACCSAAFQSGALDYDSALMSCACAPAACLGACASTVCGSSVGIDARCRDCLAASAGDGGVCAAATSECLLGAGPCAAFADCTAACPP